MSKKSAFNTGYHGNKNAKKANPKQSNLNIRCLVEEHEEWKKYAEKEGLSKSEWIIKVLNSAVKIRKRLEF